jgi:hypothetical protein
MAPTIVERDGKRYLLQRAYHPEWAADCDVAVIELTADAIAAWIAHVALAARLAAEHGLDAIRFVDYAPEFYPGEYDTDETLDDDGLVAPRWAEPTARLDCCHQLVDADGVYWSAILHHSDPTAEVETPRLDLADLQALAATLAPAGAA